MYLWDARQWCFPHDAYCHVPQHLGHRLARPGCTVNVRGMNARREAANQSLTAGLPGSPSAGGASLSGDTGSSSCFIIIFAVVVVVTLAVAWPLSLSAWRFLPAGSDLDPGRASAPLAALALRSHSIPECVELRFLS